jgi:hypothetical protein
MFSTRPIRSSFPLFALLAAASALLLVGPVVAQSPRAVYIPPDVKGYRAQQMLQQAVQQQSQRAPSAPSVATTPSPVAARHVTPVWVSVTLPKSPDTTFVAIRGPEGEVRYFPVEGGREGSHVIVVHPGERVRIQLPPTNKR